MGAYADFFKHALKIVVYSVYPLLELYGYFVFCGIFCLEGSVMENWGIVFQFVIYNFLIMIKIIVYLELFIIEDKNTLELFPRTEKNDDTRTFDNINPFILNGMLDQSSETVQTCPICKTYKPPRTHHCSIKNRCYLKFDHYCPLFDSAIGYHNYKAFYQFLVINFLSTTYFLVIIGIELFFTENRNTLTISNYIVSLSMYFIVFFINGLHLCAHTRLISLNETCVEYNAINSYIRGDYSYTHIFQEGPIKAFTSSKDRKVLNPYNLGVKNNWSEVFGKKPIEWFKPSFSSLGNGFSFKTNTNTGEEDDIYDIL